MTLGFYIQKRRPLTVVPISMYNVHTFSHAHEELATCSVCARVVALVFCSYQQAVLVIRIRIRRIRMFFLPPGSGTGSISQMYGCGSGSYTFLFIMLAK